jgi:hypothetical protein
MSFSISRTELHAFRRLLRRDGSPLKAVRSSYVTESVAAAFGYQSQAALQAALTPEENLVLDAAPSGAAFAARLEALCPELIPKAAREIALVFGYIHNGGMPDFLGDKRAEAPPSRAQIAKDEAPVSTPTAKDESMARQSFATEFTDNWKRNGPLGAPGVDGLDRNDRWLLYIQMDVWEMQHIPWVQGLATLTGSLWQGDQDEQRLVTILSLISKRLQANEPIYRVLEGLIPQLDVLLIDSMVWPQRFDLTKLKAMTTDQDRYYGATPWRNMILVLGVLLQRGHSLADALVALRAAARFDGHTALEKLLCQMQAYTESGAPPHRYFQRFFRMREWLSMGLGRGSEADDLLRIAEHLPKYDIGSRLDSSEGEFAP